MLITPSLTDVCEPSNNIYLFYIVAEIHFVHAKYEWGDWGPKPPKGDEMNVRRGLERVNPMLKVRRNLINEPSTTQYMLNSNAPPHITTAFPSLLALT